MAAGQLFPLLALLLQQAVGLRVRRPSRPPKVFYLFLAGDRVLQEEIWADYFSQGVQGKDYEAFIHCTDEGGCRRNIKFRKLFTQVATVPSAYCTNLVGPMVALAAAAYKASDPNDGGVDKFVYVSHNSLPLMPLVAAQRSLTEGNAGLALFHLVNNCAGCYKASQWSVMSRVHIGRLAHTHFAVRPIKIPYHPNAPCLRKHPRGEGACEGCADEYWPMMAIFGRDGNLSEPDEGLIRTFRDREAMWTSLAKPAWAVKDHIRPFALNEGPWGPHTFRKLTGAALRHFTSSGSVFLRKVSQNTTYEDGTLTLRQAFRKIVFRL